MGVDLSQVRIDCPMSSIFNQPRTDIEKLIFPKDPWSTSTDSIIVAQLNHFECGGIVLSACISHKVADGYSMTNFLTDWALVARDSEAKPSPLFNGASVFQPANYSAPPQVADPSRKQNASEEKVRKIPPTTVEAVTAFLCKLVKLQRLIGELREGKEKVRVMLKDIKSEELLCSRVSELATQINDRTSSNDFSIYRFSSLRKFPFDDINFGWGRPKRVDLATFPVNMFLLLDNQNGDGVDVIVNLEEGEMSVFESNEELLQFASPSSGL